jgi:beta-lactamase regulating signal transducer with metallopeptidase domain
MTAWIAWSLLTSALVAIAAGALERVAGYAGMPRRFVVIMAMIAIVVVPLPLALRAAPVRRAPTATVAIPGAIPRAMESGSVTASISAPPLVGPSIASLDWWVARAWITASSALLIVFLRALVGLARRRSRWDHEQTEIGPVFVARDDGPAVVGFVRPRVVLPRWALAADRATRTLLLRHEAEHIRAGDTRVLMAAELALVAFPWNAALWWLADRLRLAIEIDCDARVVRATGDARAYGSVLLAVGERHAAAIRFAAPLTETRLTLEARIRAMTTQPPRRPIVSSLPLVAIAIGVMTTAGWAPRPTPLLRAHAEQHPVVSPTRFHTERGPRPRPGNLAPRFPNALRAPGTDGHVIVLFSTDAHGVPDTSTITVVEGTNDLFVGAVRAVLPSWRFDSSGSVRLLFRFLTLDIEEKEQAGQPQPTYMSDSTSLGPVIIVAAVPPARDTSLASVGYSARKQSGLGFFMDGAQIDRRSAVFSEVVRVVPGFRVAPTADGRSYVISDAHDQPNGCVNVYVDGTLWQVTTPGDIDERVRPDQLVAIEAYKAASTPRQFIPAGQMPCASIIVWTRARVRPD